MEIAPSVTTKRFANLDPERRTQILRAAAEEFAAHGYAQASYNRIIEHAGSSKGAMYYYFEDKADLYVTVLRDCLARFQAFLGPLPTVDSAEGFWTATEAMFVRGMHFYEVDPTAVGLTRSLTASVAHGDTAAPLAELRAFTAAWMRGLVEVGQALGAIRTDLPVDLLLTVAVSVSDGIDLWLARHIDHLSVPELEAAAAQFVDLYRRMATP